MRQEWTQPNRREERRLPSIGSCRATIMQAISCGSRARKHSTLADTSVTIPHFLILTTMRTFHEEEKHAFYESLHIHSWIAA